MVCYNMGTETQRAKHNGILATKKGWAKEMNVVRIRWLVQQNFQAEQLEAEPRAETREEKEHTAETFKQYAEKIRSAIKPID